MNLFFFLRFGQKITENIFLIFIISEFFFFKKNDILHITINFFKPMKPKHTRVLCYFKSLN